MPSTASASPLHFPPLPRAAKPAPNRSLRGVRPLLPPPGETAAPAAISRGKGKRPALSSRDCQTPATAPMPRGSSSHTPARSPLLRPQSPPIPAVSGVPGPARLRTAGLSRLQLHHGRPQPAGAHGRTPRTGRRRRPPGSSAHLPPCSQWEGKAPTPPHRPPRPLPASHFLSNAPLAPD